MLMEPELKVTTTPDGGVAIVIITKIITTATPSSGGTGWSGKSKSSKDAKALRDGSLGYPQQVC